MDNVKFIMKLFVLILIVGFTHCVSQCDCSSLMDEKTFIRSKLLQMELDNFKIKSRLRRLEATQRHSTRPNDQKTSEDSNRQPTPDDAGEEEVRDKARMDSLEAKMSGVESLLKISVVNETDVQQGSVQSEVLDEIETKLSSISEQIKDVSKKNDANKVVLGNIVRKTLFAEKRRRIHFESIVKKSIKVTFDQFKMDSENLMRNHSNTFNEKLEQSAEIVNEVVATINKTVNEEIQSMKVSLHDVMEDLAETKTGLSNLEDETINNKQDGSWSSWQSWGSCSEPCGGGIQSRSRTCSSPKPSLLGRYCDGTPLQMRTCNKQLCAKYRVSFTAYYLDNSPSIISTFVFRNTYINYGNGYDSKTGRFTCKVSGIYHFSFTVIKYRKLQLTRVYLKVNDWDVLNPLWASSVDDKDMVKWTPLTQSGTFHLNKGDVVDVVGTPNHFFSHVYSSFTGFLITPD